jgi:acetyltransferase-like isoleucine patch superfamily enzyme
LIEVETQAAGPLEKLLKRIVKLTAGRLIAYYNRPKVVFPHKDRGLAGSFRAGEGCVMQEKVRIDCTADVEIGDRCRMIRGVNIITHTHAYLKGLSPDVTAKYDILPSALRIGNNVYIGQEAFILPQCEEIGDNAIIGARAVLTKNVGPGEVWAGNPARKVGDRKEEPRPS